MTPEEVEAEYYAYQQLEKPAGEEFEDEDFDLDSVMKATEDPDSWEDLIK